MPNWKEVLSEINSTEQPIDQVRRKHLRKLHGTTGRNVIAYYSGWLTSPNIYGVQINDFDKDGFMNAIHGLDRSLGLDLILHTPGGEAAATESIVDYLKRMFGNDIRAIIPQIAMSAGTMIACSCKSILMGKQSNIGPIDPQLNGFPAMGVIEEFERACSEVKEDPSRIPIWQVIISKYHPTFIGQCERAIAWSQKMVEGWLIDNMLRNTYNPKAIASEVIKRLTEQDENHSHSRHIHVDDCIAMGLQIEVLENAPDNLQDAVLTVHHAFMHTLANGPSYKIIENHLGVGMFMNAP